MKAGFLRKISSLFELPKEVVLNLPLVSLVGNKELTVENYKTLVEYSSTVVRINTASGVFKVEGRGLMLARLSVEAVTVTGNLEHFGYIV